LEPSTLEAAAPLLADAPIAVSRTEDPNSQAVIVSLATVFGAPSIVP